MTSVDAIIELLRCRHIEQMGVATLLAGMADGDPAAAVEQLERHVLPALRAYQPDRSTKYARAQDAWRRAALEVGDRAVRDLRQVSAVAAARA